MSRVPPRYVFLIGVLPAIVVYWIRKAVPEPAEWHAAKESAAAKGEKPPGVADLFKSPVLRTTLLTIGVCSCSLTAWWGFMFWYPQHLADLPDVRSWTPQAKQELKSSSFFLMIGVSIVGNFFAAWLARRLGYRKSIALMCLGFFVAGFLCYRVERTHESLFWWIPCVGFFSGVFALFTMYLPPLFPTLLRTTGAGFCYNIGRIAAAIGTIVLCYIDVGNLRAALFWDTFLFLPAMLIALLMPELIDQDASATPLIESID